MTRRKDAESALHELLTDDDARVRRKRDI